jgi:hypothetical protein
MIMMQSIIQVCIWYTDKLQFPYYALVLKDLRGVKEMDVCWLLPGVLTGPEAERPRVVWLIRSSAISGGHLGTWTIRISWDIPTYPTYPDLSATYG